MLWAAFWFAILPICATLALPKLLPHGHDAVRDKFAIYAYINEPADDADQMTRMRISYGADYVHGFEAVSVQLRNAADFGPVFSFDVYHRSGSDGGVWQCGPTSANLAGADQRTLARFERGAKPLSQWESAELYPDHPFEEPTSGGVWNEKAHLGEQLVGDDDSVACVRPLPAKTMFSTTQAVLTPDVLGASDASSLTASTNVGAWFDQTWTVDVLQSGAPATVGRGSIERTLNLGVVDGRAGLDAVDATLTDTAAQRNVDNASQAAIFIAGAWFGIAGGVASPYLARWPSSEELPRGRRRRAHRRRSPIAGASRSR